jgi:ribose transport system permease protein
MIIIALISLFVMKQTRLGIHMVFTGEADEAARLGGIRVKRMKILGLAISGLLAGVTAVLLAASLSSAAPTSAGDFMLTSMAAVLLGMTMVEPGRPNVLGSFIGALTIGILSNGLVLMGAPYYVQDILLGIIIVASVSISASTITKAAFSV